MAEIQLTKGQAAIVDDADFEYLSQWKWHFSHGYARRRVKEAGQARIIYMHRVIARPLEMEEVDHANMNGLDNRRENLRCCDRSQNNCNRKVRSDSKIGLKGVRYQYHPRSKKRYGAVIRINGVSKYLGAFSTPEEAHAAYVAAQPPLHKEFSRS